MNKIGMTECKTLKLDEIDNNRYVDCAGYDDCLHDAVMNNFSGFTCKGCRAFDEYKEALRDYQEYTIVTTSGKRVVKRFYPGHIDLHNKNTGTLWND